MKWADWSREISSNANTPNGRQKSRKQLSMAFCFSGILFFLLLLLCSSFCSGKSVDQAKVCVKNGSSSYWSNPSPNITLSTIPKPHYPKRCILFGKADVYYIFFPFFKPPNLSPYGFFSLCPDCAMAKPTKNRQFSAFRDLKKFYKTKKMLHQKITAQNCLIQDCLLNKSCYSSEKSPWHPANCNKNVVHINAENFDRLCGNPSPPNIFFFGDSRLRQTFEAMTVIFGLPGYSVHSWVLSWRYIFWLQILIHIFCHLQYDKKSYKSSLLL